MSGITINPALTTNAAGSFGISSQGYIQGVALDDPSLRNQLTGGLLGPNETLPMWGGVGITESLPLNTNDGTLGNTITRASSVANITGFSVFNQAHNWINSPQSPVPLASPGMGVPLFRLGSGILVPVACNQAFAASLASGSIAQQCSWDLQAQQLIPYEPAEAANVFTGMSWASTNGGTVTGTTTSAHGFAPGDVVTISGVAPTAYNGDVTLIAGTTGSTIVYLLPALSTPGAVTTQGQLNAQGGALPVQIIRVGYQNSRTVSFDGTFATWNYTGTVAVIKL